MCKDDWLFVVLRGGSDSREWPFEAAIGVSSNRFDFYHMTVSNDNSNKEPESLRLCFRRKQSGLGLL